MTTLTYARVYALAKGAGLTHDQAVMATAIAKAESGLRTDAVGDTTLTTGTWGPSVGLWQIRSLKAEKGTGRARDASRLKDPGFNARSMVSISGKGHNWGPWSVYTSGAYRAHLPAVRAAVGGASGTPDKPTAPEPNRGDPGTKPAGWDGDIPGIIDPTDIWQFGKGAADEVGARYAEAFTTGLILATALGLGVGLVVIGARKVTHG